MLSETLPESLPQCEAERKPFKIKYHYKHEFRDWIKEQFPELARYSCLQKAYPSLCERFDEVHCAASKVLDMVNQYSCQSLKDYYRPDKELLEKAYQKRDVISYANHLDSFTFAITWE